MIISFLVGFVSLAWISWQDWKTERFNLVIPLVGLVLVSFLSLGKGFGIGFLVNLLFAGILTWKKYLRPGDIVPVMVYGTVYNSFQSFFTLLMVLGLYLYTYPKITDKEEKKDWIPFIPALLTSYIIQTLITI